MTSAEWYRAYNAAASGGVQERLTRAAPSQMAQEFSTRDALRFGARQCASDKLRAATRGETKMSSHRAFRLLAILERPITHRDVVVKALKMGLDVPSEVLAEYPGLAMRSYRKSQVIRL